MQFLVTFEVETSYTSAQDMAALRARGAEFFAAIVKDSRVSSSGHYADVRGGYLVIELNSAAEMTQMLAPFLDVVRFRVNAVMPFDEFLDMFKAIDAQAG